MLLFQVKYAESEGGGKPSSPLAYFVPKERRFSRSVFSRSYPASPGKGVRKLVGFVLGSDTDFRDVEASKVVDLLDELGLKCEFSVLSAERNLDDLIVYCRHAEERFQVLIGVAGMSAVLPVIMAAVAEKIPVLGVGLVARDVPALAGLDSMLAIARRPGDRSGVGAK